MDKTAFFMGGLSVAPMIYMWIQILVVHELAWMISFVVYIFLLSALAHGFFEEKTIGMDKGVQTENNPMKDEYTQTCNFTVPDTESEEVEKSSDVSEDLGTGDLLQKNDESPETEKSSSEQGSSLKMDIVPDSSTTMTTGIQQIEELEPDVFEPTEVDDNISMNDRSLETEESSSPVSYSEKDIDPAFSKTATPGIQEPEEMASHVPEKTVADDNLGMRDESAEIEEYSSALSSSLEFEIVSDSLTKATSGIQQVGDLASDVSEPTETDNNPEMTKKSAYTEESSPLSGSSSEIEVVAGSSTTPTLGIQQIEEMTSDVSGPTEIDDNLRMRDASPETEDSSSPPGSSTEIDFDPGFSAASTPGIQEAEEMAADGSESTNTDENFKMRDESAETEVSTSSPSSSSEVEIVWGSLTTSTSGHKQTEEMISDVSEKTETDDNLQMRNESADTENPSSIPDLSSEIEIVARISTSPTLGIQQVEDMESYVSEPTVARHNLGMRDESPETEESSSTGPCSEMEIDYGFSTTPILGFQQVEEMASDVSEQTKGDDNLRLIDKLSEIEAYLSSPGLSSKMKTVPRSSTTPSFGFQKVEELPLDVSESTMVDDNLSIREESTEIEEFVSSPGPSSKKKIVPISSTTPAFEIQQVTEMASDVSEEIVSGDALQNLDASLKIKDSSSPNSSSAEIEIVPGSLTTLTAEIQQAEEMTYDVSEQTQADDNLRMCEESIEIEKSSSLLAPSSEMDVVLKYSTTPASRIQQVEEMTSDSLELTVGDNNMMREEFADIEESPSSPGQSSKMDIVSRSSTTLASAIQQVEEMTPEPTVVDNLTMREYCTDIEESSSSRGASSKIEIVPRSSRTLTTGIQQVEELPSDVSEPIVTGDNLRIRDESVEIEDTSSEMEVVPGPSTSTAGIPFPYKETMPGVKVTRQKIKFLVPTDPDLFKDYPVVREDGTVDEVAKWYLQYIKEEHEKKKRPVLQRKLQKFGKFFKKD